LHRHSDLEKEEMAQTMIRSRYIVARAWPWSRGRRRRIAAIRRRERATFLAQFEWVEEMAIQLAEIRALPEAFQTRR
jgi:hypothetical protein